MKKKVSAAAVLLALFLIIGSSGLAAQYISSEQFPPDIRWKKINTEHFTIIFPESLEEIAAETAAMLEAYYPADAWSLDSGTMRWPVILNNTHVFVNGYVSGAPRHSQLYTIPSQQGFNGTSDWLPFIWSHELRHIVQNDKTLRGFTAFARFFAGDYGSSLMSNLAIPRWLWEGDAVLTETLLSSDGRGRHASFSREMRTNLLNDTVYNYYKASLGYYGSYRDTVPSWYVSGYHLCTYIRQQYGIEAFNRIIEIAADFSFTPLILNIAVKKVTGSSIKDLYADCMEELTGLWNKQLDGLYMTDIGIIRPSSEKELSNYYPLGIFETGETAALKTSAAGGYTLVRIDADGSEQKLRRIAPIDKNISFNGRTFCWTENRKDIRWGGLSWAEIRKYTPETGEYRLLTGSTRYLSPSISPDGSRIAAVEISPELESFIVVIDAESGNLLKRFPEPQSASPSQTCWSEDGGSIIYVRQQDWMKSLRIIDVASGNSRGLSGPTSDNITSPVMFNGFIFYVSEESGIETIAALDPDGGEAVTVVSRPFGAVSPAPGTAGLHFSDYSADGFSIAAVSEESLRLTAENYSRGKPVEYFDGLQQQEAFAGFSGPGKKPWDTGIVSDYTIANHYKAAGLINFHSRSLGVPISGSGIVLNFHADDILNNSSERIFAGWDPWSSELTAGIEGAWASLYPVLLFGAEGRSPLPGIGSVFESSIYGGLRLPLDFSRGIYSHTLSLQELVLLESVIYPSSENALVSQASLSWSLTEIPAKRDIVPPLGISLSGFWLYNLVPAYYNFISAESKIYLPGILRNHGLTLSIRGDYNIASAPSNREPEKLPRGYYTGDYKKAAVFGGSIDYTLPLVYPDIAIGGLMYIPRIFINCFFDTAMIWNSSASVLRNPADNMLSTAGLELYTDFHLFNSIVPLRTGLRFIYDLNSGGIRLEDTTLLLGIDLL